MLLFTVSASRDDFVVCAKSMVGETIFERILRGE